MGSAGERGVQVPTRHSRSEQGRAVPVRVNHSVHTFLPTGEVREFEYGYVKSPR